ncbi:hypothetical protein GC207_08100 [bacterium]|nr:hypothetical protein [bacterium]
MKPIINLDDPVVKTYGRRQPPDPMSLEEQLKANAIAMQKAFPLNIPRKGVYRFKTFEEADQWMEKALTGRNR